MVQSDPRPARPPGHYPDQVEIAARRAVLGSLLAGGVLAAGTATVEAAGSSARLVEARRLRAGDLILGPAGTLVRVHDARRVDGRRVRVRYTHPATGEPTAMSPGADRHGYRPRRLFVVLLRDVPVAAVTVEGDPPAGATVVDGGAP